MDHEQKTIAIVTDVANVFDQVAVGNLHTPSLYSCFLRALINARTEVPEQGDGDASAPQDAQATSSNSHVHQHNHVNGHVSGHSQAHVGLPFHPDALENFAYSGEMGPVADISTFPPTMAPNPNGMDMSMLSMDSILSSEFWDSVLVPGAKSCGACLTGRVLMFSTG